MLLVVQWLSAVAALAAAGLWLASTQVKPITPEEAGFGDYPIDDVEGGIAIDIALLEVNYLRKQARLNRYAAAASAVAAGFQAVAIMMSPA